eukprot:scaffold2697_cov346-Pavlova_lutheri.AAC.22
MYRRGSTPPPPPSLRRGGALRTRPSLGVPWGSVLGFMAGWVPMVARFLSPHPNRVSCVGFSMGSSRVMLRWMAGLGSPRFWTDRVRPLGSMDPAPLSFLVDPRSPSPLPGPLVPFFPVSEFIPAEASIGPLSPPRGKGGREPGHPRGETGVEGGGPRGQPFPFSPFLPLHPRIQWWGLGNPHTPPHPRRDTHTHPHVSCLVGRGPRWFGVRLPHANARTRAHVASERVVHEPSARLVSTVGRGRKKEHRPKRRETRGRTRAGCSPCWSWLET